MKVLVTGSAGFIGSSVVIKLLERGDTVFGIDNHNDYYDVRLKKLRMKALKHKNYFFFQQDINSISLNNEEFDLAINLAAQAGVRVSKNHEHLYEQTNVKGFKSFCQYCVNNGISKIIYASSSSVYSDSGTGKFSENLTQLSPKSKYGQSKLQNEKYALELIEKDLISSIIGLRFFSVYGPYGRPDMAYFLFADALLKGTPIVLNNHGTMFRDMTYIDDIVDGIVRSINYISKNTSKKTNEIFNLGNDAPIETIHLLRTLEQILSKKALVINRLTKNESLYTHADIRKAKKILGYKPKTNLEEGIQIFIDWYKKYESS